MIILLHYGDLLLFISMPITQSSLTPPFRVRPLMRSTSGKAKTLLSDWKKRERLLDWPGLKPIDWYLANHVSIEKEMTI